MLSLFVSYAREDLPWCQQLERQLGALRQAGIITLFYDQHIVEGDWNGQISDRLDSADIIVLLVSDYFISKEYCVRETERAMQLHDDGKCHVLPVSLRSCLTEGAGFEHLQSTPPPDEPIDSTSWPDKAAAFTVVAAKIATVANSMRGVESRYKPAHRFRKELHDLLHDFCDRTEQRERLIRHHRQESTKTRRPFVIVLSGTQNDMLEKFRSRLQNVLIWELLHDHPTVLSPMIWPKDGPTTDSFDLFRFQLTDPLEVPVWASMSDMNKSLKKGVHLLPSVVETSLWKNPERAAAMVEAYLRLWEEWPTLPSGVSFIPVLTVKYTGNEKWDLKTTNYLDRIRFESRPRLGGVVLPKMQLVEVSDFTLWLLHARVKTLIDSDRASHEAERLPFPSAMDIVAGKNLPALLERL